MSLWRWSRQKLDSLVIITSLLLKLPRAPDYLLVLEKDRNLPVCAGKFWPVFKNLRGEIKISSIYAGKLAMVVFTRGN